MTPPNRCKKKNLKKPTKKTKHTKHKKTACYFTQFQTLLVFFNYQTMFSLLSLPQFVGLCFLMSNLFEFFTRKGQGMRLGAGGHRLSQRVPAQPDQPAAPAPPHFLNFIIGTLGEVTRAMRTHSTPRRWCLSVGQTLESLTGLTFIR